MASYHALEGTLNSGAGRKALGIVSICDPSWVPHDPMVRLSKATLTVKAAETNSTDPSLKLGVIPIGNAKPIGSFDVQTDAAHTRTYTVELMPKFTESPPMPSEQMPLGIAAAVQEAIVVLLRSTDVKPCLKINALKVKVDFGVKRTKTGTVGIDLIVISASDKWASTREDVQSLEFELTTELPPAAQ